MEVVAITGKTGALSYLVGCAETGVAVVVGPLPEDVATLQDELTLRRWRAAVELCFAPGSSRPLVARHRLVPTTADEVHIGLNTPGGAIRVPLADRAATIDPEGPPEAFAVRVGSLQVFAVGVSQQPVEVAWHIDTAVFTDRVLFAPGTWPAAATPEAVLALRGSTAVYPRNAKAGHVVSTVSLERAWQARWEARGYTPDIPDPSATVRSAPVRKSSR